MNCAYHHDREVRGICCNCGRPVCDQCLVDLNGQPYCKNCLADRVRRPKREINGFIRFALSVAPGVGHLYMGLINRGFQFFMGTAVGGIILGMIYPELLGLYIPAAIFYSIFDAREIHLQIDQGATVEDKGLVDMKALSFQWNQRHIGYGLIALGGLALWRNFTNELLRTFFPNQWWQIRDAVNGITLGALAIIAGLWLLKRNSSNRS